MAQSHAPVPIGGALREALQSQGLGFLLHEGNLRRRWVEVMGERAAGMAELDSFKDFVLTIKVAQAAWRNELHFQRDAIRQKANEVLGAAVVKDVRLR
jgi:predicted nucleic acid-binding Zn ribbon protein